MTDVWVDHELSLECPDTLFVVERIALRLHYRVVEAVSGRWWQMPEPTAAAVLQRVQRLDGQEVSPRLELWAGLWVRDHQNELLDHADTDAAVEAREREAVG